MYYIYVSLYDLFSGQIKVDKINSVLQKIDYLDRVKRFDVIRTKNLEKRT